MKKLFCFIISAMLVMTAATPCFAADITKPATSGSTVIQTKTTKQDGSDADSYTVTIPANQQYAWGTTTAQDVSYTVTSQLPYGDSLSIAVTGSSKMTAGSGNTASLSYALTGNAAAVFNELNNNAKHDVTIAISGWDNVPVAVYSDTLTYTVTYNAAA